ncbi:MAG TPA: 4'-phosphopantetheinyl transferase [Ruminiclostridium sp.]|jgi:phosphopantetheinyl transferase|uniref:4'-phosphopantetheinyl transferase n=1 Tax=Acetivibrio saccincola TaxID=1677857 RepID=A0A2K9E9K4_9FIRM|nr:4'-phosphopantetheinyl transferase superfamily protein [Acetivibrio saccincola]HAA42894.1 4'-phosphopantetheinyl transferase [Ruminiclostridium sp.]AUG58316.1 4'-phosphopantetheinyl transferase [Acetivibrio saccincola]NLW27283.1 4'-phosphopantetheinyl transferase superfamily protein [Acetivibrio saccincola]PQQ68195.1 hypothetical protein B9R14_16480 [Acetivibrio saccincola]HOA97461.1 4'-phosphopantetheinyl transferase superfamily protein [Acetivibrio saccincola]
MIPQRTKHLIELNMGSIKKHIDLNYALVDMGKMHERLQLGESRCFSLLSEKEAGYLESFKVYKKKLQWLCGRYAVKKALFEYKALRKCIVDLSCVDVLKGADSAPYIHQYPDITVSITHSFPYCIGVVSEKRIGVDVEKNFQVENSLIKFFFSEREKDVLFRIPDLNERNAQAIKYWTRKEAVSKFLRLGMKMNFKELDTVDDVLEAGGYKIKLFSFLCDDCCLSLAIPYSESL